MNLLQADPFPPTDIEAIAITNIGLMFAHIFVLLFLLLLMLYLFFKMPKDLKECLPILVVYMFSLLIGMESFGHLHTPFSPNFEFFFLVFQTSLFLLSSFTVYSNYHNGGNI